MSKTVKIMLITAGSIAVVLFTAYRFFGSTYNSLVHSEESVKAAWSQVENVYQRRADLIPNLVNTAKGYANHESKVFTEIAEARSKAGGMLHVSDEVLNNPEQFRKFQKAQAQLGSALQRLLVVAEKYPDLKANESFLNLQSQLEGTENRIAIERKRYNDVVQHYNTSIRLFPKAMLARMYGFFTKPYFAADEGAEKAPAVTF